MEQELKMLMDKAEQSAGGSVVNVLAYRDDNVAANEELKMSKAQPLSGASTIRYVSASAFSPGTIAAPMRSSLLRGGAVSRNEARRRAIEALDLVEQIRPILAARDEGVQSAALAELLAVWIAGHMAGPPGQTVHQWREELLQKHIELVRQLIVPSETERGAS